MFRTYYNTYKNTSFAYNSYIIRQFPQKVWLQGKQLRPLISQPDQDSVKSRIA